MLFSELVAPLTPEQFMERYRARVCFFVRGTPEKFRDLISLQEIEDRINEACNISSPLEIIKDGMRSPLVNNKHFWSQMALRKKEIRELLETRHSFLMMNMSQINPRVARLIDGIEDVLREDNLHADLHLYVSTTRAASAYNAHRDYPQHKIYLQVIGRTEWRLYELAGELASDVVAVPAAEEPGKLREVAKFVLNPGDLFYMPPAVFHKIRNLGGPRVSFSIPCSPGKPGMERMDRTHIPFRAIFEAEQQAAAQEAHADDDVDPNQVTVAGTRGWVSRTVL